MSSIGKIGASVAAVQNENTAALINNNFDFTLVKLAVPPEYIGLGSTISRRRKTDAEDGALHKTARKLGALFEGVLPRTDELFRAYGRRVSEITSNPLINPREGSGGGGIFAHHIGADTTSIWAAVTSGRGAIAVHLWGCMLARMFTIPEAISLWVELVQKQKEHIRKDHEDELYSHEQNSQTLAAKQDITRAELAAWDASARAWLRSADEAKAFQHKQTMLILNNSSVPINTEQNPHKSVIKAWTSALEAVNSLVKGLPQRVQDAAALLALSSWHLYPDMAVYGTSCVQVRQRDSLFTPTSLLTLGLEHVREGAKSVFWSLPLACLQYYGHPIQTSRLLDQENSRTDHEQFAYVVLGCIFECWSAFATNNEEAFEWLRRLEKQVERSAQTPTDDSVPYYWFTNLVLAMQRFDCCEESENKVARQLLNLGRRRSTFLYPSAFPPPIFGLSQLEILLHVLEDDVERVALLRQLYPYLKLDDSSLLIRYPSPVEYLDIEYASVAPTHLIVPSTKRRHDGQPKEDYASQLKHTRWIRLTKDQIALCIRWIDELDDLPLAQMKLKDLEALRDFEFESVQVHQQPIDLTHDVDDVFKRHEEIAELKIVLSIGQRRLAIEKVGERCLPVAEYASKSNSILDMSVIFGIGIDFMQLIRNLGENLTVDDWDLPLRVVPATPEFFIGDPKFCAICSIRENGALGTDSGLEPISKFIVEPGLLKEALNKRKFNSRRLLFHFSNPNQESFEEIRCLQAFEMMSGVYRQLPGATISTSVVCTSISRAKWIPLGADRATKSCRLCLSEAFACIAMFESGTCNLDPQSLSEAFAMSSGNSLFVAGSLLCDPYDQPSSTEIRRVVGNIGRSGITFLIPPPEVNIREANPENWRSINHNSFDGGLENHFERTSVHLSFTQYEIPLVTENVPRHFIDRTVMLVETLVSVYDGGEWVAEVNILEALQSILPCETCSQSSVHGTLEQCHRKETYQEVQKSQNHLLATSIENWDELIEAPRKGVMVVRAHKNWLARLATTAVCVRCQITPIILPEEPCWRCCSTFLAEGGPLHRCAFIC